MFDAGRVRIQLGVADGLVANVAITSERPQVAALFRGKPANEVARLVPLLYSVCGKAQSRAAMLALAAARGETVEPHLDSVVQREAVREHLWRLLLDLPPLLGLMPQRELFLAGIRMVESREHAGLQAFLCQPFWNELRTILEVMEQPSMTAIGFLPNLNARESLNAWPRLTAAFAAHPTWKGRPAETGAIARGATFLEMTGAYVARWVARINEIAQWAGVTERVGSMGTASAVSVEQGIGRALVSTARGILMHEIALDGECIVDYVIVAPTEWNFHPHGRLADWLRGMPATGLEQRVALAVAALDPCVRWELEALPCASSSAASCATSPNTSQTKKFPIP